MDDAIETLRGEGLASMVANHPNVFVKYHAGFEKLATHAMKPRRADKPPEIWWLYGSTGVGKSRHVHEKEMDLFVALGTHKWWQGYTQQQAILIDDMRCNYAPFNELLKILDIYPYKGEVKGGHVHINSPRIYITSQFPPHSVYNRSARSGEDIAQLYRRLSHVVSMSVDSDGKALMKEMDKTLLLKEDEATATAEGFVHPWETTQESPPMFGVRKRRRY